jgi:hypothetical protein
MDTSTKIKLLSVTALITALLGTYFTALHIDSLAREKYIFKRWLFFPLFVLIKNNVKHFFLNRK